MERTEVFHRQLDLIDNKKLSTMKVTIIGAGGIGSPTALCLGKLGVDRIKIFDYDIIELHNMPSQFLTKKIGSPKVYELKELTEMLTFAKVEAVNEAYNNQHLEDVVIAAVDSMEARRSIWNKVKNNYSINLFIDARMAGQYLEIYTVDPLLFDDITMYEKYLYTDEEAHQEKCTEKAIIYNTMGIASFIANQIKKYNNSEEIHRRILFDYQNLILIKHK